MMKKSTLFYLSVLALLLVSCSDNDLEDTGIPSVAFANAEGVFEVKTGKSITIEPLVEDAVDPFFVWKLNGEIVSRDAVYEFASKIPGQYFLTFQVDAANGKVEKEARVDVLERTPPKVQLPAEAGYIHAVTGRESVIEPVVTHTEGATYRWLLNREEVSTDKTYTFKQTGLGDYNLVLIVQNEDGEGRAEAVVRVGEVPELTLWFEHDNITVPKGRKAVLALYTSYATENTTYEWEVDGAVQPGETKPLFSFTPAEEKEYTVQVRGKEGEFSAHATIVVKSVSSQGVFRPATGSSSPYSTKVFEFLPAPGQFVNEGYAVTTQEQANAYAEKQLAAKGFVSLGGFGGYIVVGFDHSIKNTAGYDLAIRGNAFKGSSEPGVVWVMSDENGNGLPDDTWYELKGSESGKPGTRQQYAVTYFRPTGSRQDVRWKDNYGETGTVDINNFHGQDSYYPNWITAPSYTLYGTFLESRTYDQSGNGTYWINAEFDWGYADNFGTDLVGNETVLDLSNAVYPDGTPAGLEYIDFVKVHTGVNVKAGWLGESSTEVFGFRDMNME